MFVVPISSTTDMYLLFKQAVCYAFVWFNFILIVTFVCFVTCCFDVVFHMLLCTSLFIRVCSATCCILSGDLIFDFWEYIIRCQLKSDLMFGDMKFDESFDI